MDCVIKNDIGTVSMTDQVLEIVAGVSAVGCYGIVAMAAKRATDGLVELLGMDNITRGVKVRVNDNAVVVDLFIIVEYGISIAAVAKSAIQTVKYDLETLTGMTVSRVNITVEGIRV